MKRKTVAASLRTAHSITHELAPSIASNKRIGLASDSGKAARHVVLLRGVNVGGHRTFRPAGLAADLKHLDAVNIGAAGTFVIRAPISSADLRAEFQRRLPFVTEIIVCRGREIAALMSRDIFVRHAAGPGTVGFVTVLSRAPRVAPEIPITLPERGQWMLRVLARDGRFVVGQYRRHMKAIGYLGTLDRIFGGPATTRNWNTMAAIVRALEAS